MSRWDRFQFGKMMRQYQRFGITRDEILGEGPDSFRSLLAAGNRLTKDQTDRILKYGSRLTNFEGRVMDLSWARETSKFYRVSMRLRSFSMQQRRFFGVLWDELKAGNPAPMARYFSIAIPGALGPYKLVTELLSNKSMDSTQKQRQLASLFNYASMGIYSDAVIWGMASGKELGTAASEFAVGPGTQLLTRPARAVHRLRTGDTIPRVIEPLVPNAGRQLINASNRLFGG
jgi:hypothetical protein